MPEQAHPRPEDWIAFAQGTLPPERVEDLGTHLAACDTCCELVRTVPEDEFITLVRQADTLTAPAADTPPEGTIEFHPDDRLPFSLASAVTQGDGLPAAEPQPDRTIPPGPAAAMGLEQATIDSQVSLQGAAGGATLSLDAVLVDHPRYRIVRILGQGGMGAVYLAEHRLMHRTVALKVIRPDLVANPTAIERFRREFQAAARLHHPNIVTAHDAEEYQDTHFLAMEYVEGVELADVLAEGGPLPIHQACDYVRQAAVGLQHAHENGMAHRDIKPQNLMLTPAGQVKILDFGLASLGGEETTGTGLTLAGTIMGTPDYIAPEQARDASSADIRADIYSLGCTLYALLAGRVPFPEGKAMDKIVAHLQKEPPPIAKHRPDVPAGLRSVLARMMAKNRDDRFATPAEVAAALEPFCTPEGIEAARRPQRRRTPLRRVAALLAVAAALIVAGVVLFLQTRHGTVRIEIGDPNIKVAFGDRTFTVDDSGETITVRPGEHSLHVERGDLKFETPQFTLGRGENPALRVEFFKGQVVVTRGETELAKRGVLDTKPAKDEITLVRKFEGHTGPVMSVAFSPDGTLAASASGWPEGDRTVRLWRVADGKESKILRGHTDKVLHVTFTPDGKRVISCAVDGTVRLWDVSSGRELNVLLVGLRPHSVAVDARGEFLLVESMLKLERRELSDPRKITWSKKVDDNQERILAVRISPDGKWFVTGDARGRVVIGDTDTGQQIKTLITYPSAIEDLALSPDGSKLLIGGHAPAQLIVATKDGTILQSLPTPKANGVAMSPDGRYAALATINGACVYHLETGKRLDLTDAFNTGDYQFWDIAYSPDGRWLVAGGGSKYDPAQQRTVLQKDYALRLWRLPEKVWPQETAKDEITLVHSLSRHTGSIRAVGFSPDGKRLISVSRDDTVRVWDMAARKQVSALVVDAEFGATISGDGQRVAVARPREQGGDVTTVEIWDLQMQKRLQSMEAGVKWLSNLAFSPDRRLLAAGGDRGRLFLWNVESGKSLATLELNCQLILAVTFSPDGRTVAVALHEPRKVELWDVETRKKRQELVPPRNKGIHDVAFSSDGTRLVIGQQDGSICLFDVRKRDPLRTLLISTGNVESIAFLPGDRFVLACTMNQDRALHLWDLQSGEVIATVPVEKDVVNQMAISPDGRHAVTGGGDSWNDATKRVEHTGDYALRLWQLPESVWPKETAKDHRAELTLKKGGPNLKLFLDGKEYVRGSDVVARLTERAQADPKLEVHLLGDVDLEDRYTRDFFGLLTGAGIQRIVLPPAVEAQLQAAARRLARQNDLKQITLALHSYHDAHGSFPPAARAAKFARDGTPLLSWRVHLLPYLEEEDLYRQFRLDEPWNSPHNRKLLDRMPKLFRGGEDPTRTTVVAVVGPGTAYEGKAGFALKEIADGPSATIQFVDAGADKAVPWTKPEGLPFDPENPLRPLGTLPEGYLLAAFCDGAVREVSTSQTPAALRALFTRAGKEEAAPASTRLPFLHGMGLAGRMGPPRPGANPLPGPGVLHLFGDASTAATPPDSK